MTPLILFSLSVVVGILITGCFSISPAWWLLALPGALVLWWGWGARRWARYACLALVGLLLGAGRMWLATPQLDAGHVASYADLSPLARVVAIEGVVVVPPEATTKHTSLHLRTESITLPDGTTHSVRGRLLVWAPLYTAARYGDRLRITGELQSLHTITSLPYRRYLERQRIYATLGGEDVAVTLVAPNQANPLMAALLKVRAAAHRTLQHLLPEPQASLLAGILLGIEEGIPDALEEAFRATGTSHIVAISGFNLTLIAGLFAQGAYRVWPERRRLRTLVALGGLWLYVLLVGASAAVMRAGVMASVGVLAKLEGRRVHGPTSLAFAVWVLSLLNPHMLWDVGFQLSFTATLGLILYTPPLERGVETLLDRLNASEAVTGTLRWLSDELAVTLAAQVTTLGVIVGTFGRLSAVTLLANFLILPVQGWVMSWGGIALLAGMVLRPVGRVLAMGVWVWLTYTIESVRALAGWQHAVVELPDVSLLTVIGYYLLLGMATVWFSMAREQRQQAWRALTGVERRWWALGSAGVIVLGAALHMLPDGRLHVSVLDVAGGDAVIIETPGGRRVLVDGGPDGRATLAALGRRMPFWERELDLVVLTAPEAARAAGLLPVLERYDVRWVGQSPGSSSDPAMARWTALVAARTAGSSGVLEAGMRWQLDAGVALDVLWPPPGVAGPVVLRLSYREASVLLTGAATTSVEEALVAAYGEQLRSQALLIPRGGAATAATPAFLQAVAPEVALVTATERYPPTDYVLARLGGTPLYRTDRHGAIELVSEGTAFTVRTSRRE